MSKIMSDFYILSDLLGDNLELVAIIIHKHHSIKYKLSAVIADVEENSEERIGKYHQTINKILDLPYRDIKNFITNHTKGLFDE